MSIAASIRRTLSLPVRSILGMRARLAAARHNRGLAPEGRRILALRDPRGYADYNDPFLAWARAEAPDAAARIELRYLPLAPSDLDLSRTALLVPWVQDPLRERDPAGFERIRALEDACAARGIPVVNPVETLSRSRKSVALERMRAAGVTAPRALAIGDASAFRAGGWRALGLPFFVREDMRHGGPVHLVEREEAIAALPLEGMESPVAIERIELRSPADGLHRKWRYLALGPGAGAPRHMVAAREWVVHAEDRVLSPATLAEERAYVEAPDPRAPLLESARAALGLDVVAFDYALLSDGRPVVWEPNPFPTLWAPFNERRADLGYQRPTIARVFAALLAYLLERAGLEALMPDAVRALRDRVAPPRPLPSREATGATA